MLAVLTFLSAGCPGYPPNAWKYKPINWTGPFKQFEVWNRDNQLKDPNISGFTLSIHIHITTPDYEDKLPADCFERIGNRLRKLYHEYIKEYKESGQAYEGLLEQNVYVYMGGCMSKPSEKISEIPAKAFKD